MVIKVFAALARKNISRKLFFSRKAAEGAKASQGVGIKGVDHFLYFKFLCYCLHLK